jgi:predicted ribosomally synthesized peptide with nif11-like leader
MSIESANRFLSTAATDEDLRFQFRAVHSPEDFLNVSQELGYSFTTTELLTLAQEYSQEVITRRSTGVWKWLRRVDWV